MDGNELQGRPTVIGGRHGSPSLTIALPFANVVNKDEALRDAVADLALLVSRLAAADTTAAERELVCVAATELAERVAAPN